MNLDEILLKVQKPGRYVGGEWNSVRKEWLPDRVKFLLAFPDVYEIGMSHLGLKILYGILNERDDCLCERVFSPWPDFEEVLRKNKLDIFSLESRRPIKEFDIIGFSLAHELNYTNVLNILDLGNIPVRSSERGYDDPLIIAGGPSCFNPEPMAEFIDAFVIGDGEDVIAEIIETYKSSRGREQLLRNLTKIDGAYVPSLYDPDSPRIKKRIVKDLNAAFYPTRQIVPNIQIVHDRIAIEIMRGCKHICKFCQATTTYGPCRERSKEKILDLAKEAYSMTGYDEISLLSLSSSDYSSIKEVIKALNGEFSPKAVSISVPSLRIQETLEDLPTLVSKVKKSTLTFAPESGSISMRRRMNKNIDIEKLYSAATESFRRGWRGVKLYFMIGLPEEKDEDIMSIADLALKISDLKRSVDGKPAHVTASVNAFVPKPHTPFQREAMDTLEELERKKDLLKRSVPLRMVKLDFHSFHMSFIEAALSRGDRKVSKAIYAAWQRGGRFDSWQDFFKFDLWLDSFKESNIDPSVYVNRKLSPGDVLPWSFLRP